jgi:hypothetical protein
MREQFDFTRFMRSLWLTWVEQPLLPYLLIPVVLALQAFWLLGTAQNSPMAFNEDRYTMVFTMYILLCGWLYAGLSYSLFGEQDKGMQYLMVPASVLEKFLAKVFLVFAVFPLICVLVFYGFSKLVDLATMNYYAVRFRALDLASLDTYLTILFFYLGLPVALVSGLIWRRFGVFKMALSLSLILTVFLLLVPFVRGMTVMQNMEPPGSTPLTIYNAFWYLAFYLPAALCLIAAYFLLREKEI